MTLSEPKNPKVDTDHHKYLISQISLRNKMQVQTVLPHLLVVSLIDALQMG